MYGLALRGIPGNPTAAALNDVSWTDKGPLELSPDRGRFALTYSMIEDHRLQFSLPLARFTLPDLGLSRDGKYVSLFAPGVSFLTIPGYVIGKYFGVSQVGTFAVIAWFATANIMLLRAITIRLGAHRIAATIGALTFGFATPAFAYGVSLYQHHVSLFLILLSVYTLLRWQGGWAIGFVWFLLAVALVVDNPNIFFAWPIGLFALTRMVVIDRQRGVTTISIRRWWKYTWLTMVIPLGLFLWFNQASSGHPLQLPGTLVSVPGIDAAGHPVKLAADPPAQAGQLVEQAANEKSALGFFKTRNLLNGFYIHVLSPDRGLVYFAPVILFGIFGLVVLARKNRGMANLLVGILAVNILVYSMWGDPWGGWAFGSRYLLPTYAVLGIGVGIALDRWRRKYWRLLPFGVVMAYSVWVNTLGATTSNRNPPQIEILALEKASGHQEKYTIARNIDMLVRNESKSYVFQAYAHRYLSAWQYQWYLSVFVVGVMSLCLVELRFTQGGEEPDGTS